MNLHRLRISRSIAAILLLIVVAILIVMGAAWVRESRAHAAIDGPGIRMNADGTINCIENGWKYTPDSPDKIAPAQHCFFTKLKDEDKIESVASQKKQYASDAEAQKALEEVENRRLTGPGGYFAKDTFAGQPLTGDEPIVPYSEEMGRQVMDNTLKNFGWWMGSNFGGKPSYGGKESIPIYTVDSSNPKQHYITVVSNDNRVKADATNARIMTGQIPFPKWAIDGIPISSGDRSIAIYDTATGIWRSMFFFVPDTDASGNTIPNQFKFSSGGFIQAKPDFEGMGEDNFWLTLIKSTSSVVGMANELTKIGVDELRAGEINHMISMTWRDYPRQSSFPAKMADGSIDPGEYPYSPSAGQMFTLPDDFDIDGYVDRKKLGSAGRMILKAIQKYGGIITDRNLAIQAVNFEEPSGYAPYARQGKNVYLEDPEIKELLKGFHADRLPLKDFIWIEKDYAGAALANGKEKQIKAPGRPHVPHKGTMTTDIYSSVYKNEYAFEEYSQHVTNNGNETNGPLYYPDMKEWKSGTQETSGGSFDMRGYLRFIPKANFVGNTQMGIGDGWSFNGGVTPTVRTWHVRSIEHDQPNARTDYVSIPKGSSKTISPLSNDDTAKGAGSAGFASITLLNDSDNPVNSVTVGEGTTATIGANNTVTINASNQDNGYYFIKYRATTNDGKTSDGRIRVTVTDPTLDYFVNGENSSISVQAVRGETTAASAPALSPQTSAGNAEYFPLYPGTAEWVMVDKVAGATVDREPWMQVASDGALTITPPSDIALGNYTIPVRVRYPDMTMSTFDVKIGVVAQNNQQTPPPTPPQPPQNPDPNPDPGAGGGNTDPGTGDPGGGANDPGAGDPGTPGSGNNDPGGGNAGDPGNAGGGANDPGAGGGNTDPGAGGGNTNPGNNGGASDPGNTGNTGNTGGTGDPGTPGSGNTGNTGGASGPANNAGNTGGNTDPGNAGNAPATSGNNNSGAVNSSGDTAAAGSNTSGAAASSDAAGQGSGESQADGSGQDSSSGGDATLPETGSSLLAIVSGVVLTIVSGAAALIYSRIR